MQNEKPSMEDLLGKAAFDIEHALSMYATSFATIPVEAIYDTKALASIASVTETCHVYLIGYTPMVDFIDAEQKDDQLLISLKVLGQKHTVSFIIPEGQSLKKDGERWHMADSSGNRYWPENNEIQSKLSLKSKMVNFEVKYVGQAYGKDGSRNAIDRLIKHETLQKIAIKGVPDGYRITILMLAVQTNSQILTSINPFAKNTMDGTDRIEKGMKKLFSTTEEEIISLYEAALIRYFHPEFNKELKNSFPSTNLKILRDCYEKDFAAVVAEIHFDDLPFRLWSDAVDPAFYHLAKHDIHKREDRAIFFGL